MRIFDKDTQEGISKFLEDLTIIDVSTEIDLDRDVPSGEIEWDGCGPSAGSYPNWEGWNVWNYETEDGDIMLTINSNNIEQDYLDVYCEEHPDFNDAMNRMVY